ncbi:hypothetical protein [Alistipes ihumii]|uniref:hypothetical protein n=1 Tax=Alistipes ihumii TaxID=1470347 RepID=UPI0023566BDC|nr:hypothetical protein [Alistipes ihumii]
MKKILLSALPVLCAALLMTACDDDDNATANYSVPLDEAVGSYTGDKLQINVGGQSVLLLSGETAQISGSDANQLTISIPDYAVPGETGLTFTDVKMTTPLFNVFEGTSSNASRDITLSGELRDGRLTLNLTPTYKSDIIGVWNLNLETDDFGTATLTPISIETEQDISGSQFIVQILGVLLKGSMAVVNIDFQADGNLTATYNSNLLNDLMPALSNDTIHPVFVHSPLNAIKWYVKDDALYLVPNLNLMLKNDPSKAQLGPLDPGTITTVGIPLYFKKEGDKMTVYVSKEQTAPVFGLLSTVISMIDPSFELSLGGSSLPLRSLLEALVKPLIDAALAAERFDLCLNLVAGAIPEEAPQPGEEASAAAVKRLEAFIAQQ